MMEQVEADVFIVVPCLVILKALDKDDKHLCKYFLPNLNQIDTKTFRNYYELDREFDEWKKSTPEHYTYYNILEKLIIGIGLSAPEQQKYQQFNPLVTKIISKIKILGSELHRFNPPEWNAFMEVCMAGIIGP